MGIYDKKKSISRKELESVLRKDKGRIPGTWDRKYYRREREKIAKEVFKSKYGSEISKSDYRRAVRELESAGRKTKSSVEKKKINRKIGYLKELGGKRVGGKRM